MHLSRPKFLTRILNRYGQRAVRATQIEARTTNHVLGVDVSNNQGLVNARAIHSAGYRFLFHKVSDGVGWADGKAAANLHAARAAGLKVGGYAFVEPRAGRSGKTEAAYFIGRLRALGFGPGDLRPVLDVETRNDQTNAQVMAYVGQMVDEIRHELGIVPIIYTFPAFASWTSTFGCPLWIANFEVARPTIPRPWDRYAIWQHSSKAKVAGVAGYCDVNIAPDLGAITWPEPPKKATKPPVVPAKPAKPVTKPKPSVPSACRAPTGVNVRLGSKGARVRQVQQWINVLHRALPGHYPLLEVDGKYGAKTEAAVKRYQGRHRLPKDGVVGRKTWEALCQSASAKLKP